MSHQPAVPPVVVITGASSGIGRAIALAFSQGGSPVVLAARRQAVLEEVAKECVGESLVVSTDVTDAAAVQALARAAIERFGRVDVWVNCAVVAAVGEFNRTPMEAHEQCLRVGLLGCMHGAHAILPHFRERGVGRLIQLNSLGAWVPAPYVSAYSAVKFGLRGFSEALRGELHTFPNIHVCDVHPGFVDTPAFQKAANFVGKEIKPIPPLLQPAQVAEAVVRLWEHPRDRTMLGSTAILGRIAYALSPALVSAGMGKFMETYFKYGRDAPETEGNLYRGTGESDSVSGGWSQRLRGKSGVVLAGGMVAVGAGYALARFSSKVAANWKNRGEDSERKSGPET